MESITVSDDLKRGRNRLAVTVVLGHAIKHIYISGLQTILLPEIKFGLGISATQLGALAFSRQVTGWVTTVGAGYLGDRFANRASLMLGISPRGDATSICHWMAFRSNLVGLNLRLGMSISCDPLRIARTG